MSQHLDRPVQLNLLGEFQLIVEGVDKTPLITYSKPKLLLALLALSPDKKSSRAALANMLWPHAISGARANLRHALCMVRQVLGPTLEKAVIQSTTSTLALNKDWVVVDVHVVCGIEPYAHLNLAQRLHYDRGELLDDLLFTNYAGLSAWRMSWQSRLSQEISQIRQATIAQLCAQGAIQEALASAQRWVQDHPSDEHAHRHLIRLLDESGQREAAIKAYEHCIAVMGERYGAAPTAETGMFLDKGQGAYSGAGQPASSNDGLLGHPPSSNPSDDPLNPTGHITPKGTPGMHVKVKRPSSRPVSPHNAPGYVNLKGTPLGAIRPKTRLFAHPSPQHARPLAILAVAITYQGNDIPGEDILAQVHQARERLIRLARATGRRVCLGADGNLAVMFGYPNLNERPTEAAAHFACHIQRFLMAPGISFCIGIHADLIAMASPDQGALPMMLISQRASRLAYLAAPGETLLTDTAQSRLSDHFWVRADERYGLPVGILARQYNTIAVHRMFGRSVEFDILVARWNSLAAPPPQPLVMLLHGESGIGKSLLLQVFAEYVRHSRGSVTVLRCDQENRQTALHPFQQFFFQRLSTHKEAADSDRMAGALRAMESLGYGVGLDKKTSMSLANYFVSMQRDVLEAGTSGSDDTSPQALIAPLLGFLLHREVPEQPLLLILDDVQWSDTVTLSLVRTLLRHARRQPTMLVLGGRSVPPNIPIDETINMRPLGPDAMTKMVNYWTRDQHLSSRLRHTIVEKAQGVPLYAEEMVRQHSYDLDLEATPLISDLRAARKLAEAQDPLALGAPRSEFAQAMPFWEIGF